MRQAQRCFTYGEDVNKKVAKLISSRESAVIFTSYLKYLFPQKTHFRIVFSKIHV